MLIYEVEMILCVEGLFGKSAVMTCVEDCSVPGGQHMEKCESFQGENKKAAHYLSDLSGKAVLLIFYLLLPFGNTGN